MKNALITLGFMIVISLLALAVYLGLKKVKTGDSGSSSSGLGSLLSSVTAGSTATDAQFPLSYNPHAKYDTVRSLQQKLNRRLEANLEPNFPKDSKGQYIKSLVEDGYFGEKTLAVVKYIFNGEEVVTKDMYNSL